MRIVLIFTAFFSLITLNLFAQNDFYSLDKQTYDYYLSGNYKELEKTGKMMLSKGIDYYYLRMRMGILAYNNQRYSKAFQHFEKALTFNSLDTLSKQYIYNSYLFSGRESDANLYIETIPWNSRNNVLRSVEKLGISEVHFGSTVIGYDQILYSTNSLFYEAIDKSLSIHAGLENYFSKNIKGNFSFTNYNKTGISYSSANPNGSKINFTQNQVYAKLTGLVYPGWEFSTFGQMAFYKNGVSQFQPGNRNSAGNFKKEYLLGAGITKNGWKVRSGVNVSYSNFSDFISSKQIRAEGYITYLPFGNLNLYFTTGGMGQNDSKWGSTYQVNQEIGFKVLKKSWFEAGINSGNSFLYARNQGLILNNSFQVPATTIYTNFIVLLGNKFNLTLSPFYSKIQSYSINLNTYTRTDKIDLNTYGCSIMLTYKNK